MGSQSYKDLIVWQKSVALCTHVYQLCEKFPRSELYGLADQMKRAAVSVSSNIAEGQRDNIWVNSFNFSQWQMAL